MNFIIGDVNTEIFIEAIVLEVSVYEVSVFAVPVIKFFFLSFDINRSNAPPLLGSL